MNEPDFRRQHFRVTITHDDQLRAKVWQITADRPFTERIGYDAVPARVLNISEGGMLFAIDHLTYPFASHLGIALERHDVRLIVQAEVRHLQEAPNTPTKIGLQFLFAPEDPDDRRVQQTIAHLVAEIQREQLQRYALYRGGV